MFVNLCSLFIANHAGNFFSADMQMDPKGTSGPVTGTGVR